MKMKQTFSLLLSVMLSLQVMSVFASASTSQEPPFFSEGIELEVETKYDKATSSSQKMEYEIDVFSKKEKKKVGTLNLTFDYNFSPEKAQAEIKNPKLKPTSQEDSWSVKGELIGMAGSGTDLAGIEYRVDANKNEKFEDQTVNYSDSFMVTADKDGQTKIVYSQGINLNVESQKEQSDTEELEEKLVKAYEPVTLSNAGITYQIKEYQTEASQLETTTTLDNHKVDDLSEKTARFEISFSHNGEPIGRQNLKFLKYYYSPSESYSFLVGNGYQMEGVNDWEFVNEDSDSSMHSTNIGMGSEISFYGNDLSIKDGEKTLCTLRITVTADAKGNLTMKPILAL